MNHARAFRVFALALLAALLPVASFGQAPAPATPQEITVSEEILAQYVGSYPLAPNFILAITLENGQLMAQATGQGKNPIFAETETRFFLKVVDATLDFQKDAAGVVTGLVLNQNGASMPATKQ